MVPATSHMLHGDYHSHPHFSQVYTPIHISQCISYLEVACRLTQFPASIFFFFSTIFFLDLVQTIDNIFSRLMQCGRRYPHRHQLENFKFMGR